MKIRIIKGRQLPWLQAINAGLENTLKKEDFRSLQANEVVDIPDEIGEYLCREEYCERIVEEEKMKKNKKEV